MRMTDRLITIRQRLRALRADARGVSMIEFGLVLPVIGLFLLGTLDITRAVIARFTLEQVAQHSIERLSLGNRSSNDYTYLAAPAAAEAGVPVAQVTVNQWLECRTAAGVTTRQASFTGTCSTGQTEARYVQVSIWQNYVPSFRYMPFGQYLGAAADGSFRVVGDAAVRVQ